MSDRETVCALAGCDRPTRKGSKYCSDRDRIENARQRHESRRSDRQLGNDTESVVQRERERMQNQEAAKTLLQLQRSEAKRREYISALRDVLEPLEPSTPMPVRFKQGTTEISWGLALSDWQLGQHTPIQSTGGVYEQTTEITKRQIEKLWSALCSIFQVEVVAGGKVLNDVWLNFIGDLVDGDCLRPSQAREIDKVVMRQVIDVYDLASLLIRNILGLPGIQNIVIDMVGGNHDRTSTKAGNAGLGELDYVDTYAWLIGTMLERAFAAEPRVSIKTWETFYGYRKFGGLRHVFEHGASFRGGAGSYGGIPWYPISNAAAKLVDMMGGADFVWMGHFHQPAVLPLGQEGFVVMNGALTASSTFIQSSFKALRKPMQWLVEFHKEHGATQFLPIYADVGQLAKRGSAWEKAS